MCSPRSSRRRARCRYPSRRQASRWTSSPRHPCYMSTPAPPLPLLASPTRALLRSPRLASPPSPLRSSRARPARRRITRRSHTEEPMRRWIGVSLLAAAPLLPQPAAAQDAEALRRELEQMRKQFEGMKESYEKAIDSLSERLQKLE